MTPKEKAEQLFDKINNCIPIEASFNDTAEQASDKISRDHLATRKIVEIAEDFAIGFAEWLKKPEYRNDYQNDFCVKELIEIYKKEKGL